MIVLTFLFYYLLLIPISRLPYPVLYAVSDGLYYLVYYGVGYRKAVVMQNVRNSFPDKSEKEQLDICKKFYRHLCDLIVESVKVFTISKKDVRKRMVVKNEALLSSFFDRQRSVIIAGGHYNNWELFAVAVAAPIQHKAIAIYKPLTNLFFDRKMRETRSKYGLRMISTKIVKEVFEAERTNLTATIFGTDQSPPHPDKCHWMKFLNQDTGVLYGAERYAREYNYPVVFCRIEKVKRGYYCFEFLPCCDEPLQTLPGEITEKITRMLEADIIKQPEYWLWTHKRWKHKRPEPSSFQQLS
jgi:Kdo2-lipid IVA lauroyltransferase/acyltransferase